MDIACDKRLARLISNIHHTNNHRQYCLVGNTAQHCRLGYSTRLEINLGEVNLICIRKANICSHQLDVQEANVSVSRFHRIGSCFFGCLFANGWYLDLWDVVIEVLHSSKNAH